MKMAEGSLRYYSRLVLMICIVVVLECLILLYYEILTGNIKHSVKSYENGSSELKGLNNALFEMDGKKQKQSVPSHITVNSTLLASRRGALNEIIRNPDNHTSLTKPPFYPKDGTGKTVNISKDVDLSVFNSFCQNTALTIILPVYSATGNFAQRIAIRQSFGQTCSQMKRGCKLFFILGVDLNRAVFNQVIHEYNTMKDILLIDKIDTYRDLNNKAVAMINWIDQFCSQAKYVLHVVDDVYPNIELFLHTLEAIKQKDFILGKLTKFNTARRGKFATSFEEYPYTIFPLYALGAAYAFPVSTAKLLQSAFYISEYCWIEDVWITGHVREKAEISAFEVRAKHEEMPNRNAIFSQTLYYHNVHLRDFSFFYNTSRT